MKIFGDDLCTRYVFCTINEIFRFQKIALKSAIMKNINYLLTALIASSISIGCASYSGVGRSDLTKTEITKVLETQNFKFVATRAFPMDPTVVNVMNSMSPRGSSTQVFDLDSGAGFSLKEGVLEVDLPFFGTRYRADYNPDSNGFKYNSDKFTIVKTEKGSKTMFLIQPQDSNHINKIYLEIYSNGHAYVSISANDRQPITYDGYITAAQ